MTHLLSITGVRRAVLALVCVLGAVLMPAAAQVQESEPVTVRVQAPKVLYVGDTADLAVVIRGSRNVAPPDLSAVKDATILYRAPQDSSSTMTTIINGQVTTKNSITYSHFYAITANRPGTLTIPSLSVVVDGKTITTQPVTIEVREPTQTSDFGLEVRVEPPTAYVGQPVRVTLTWTLTKPVRNPGNNGIAVSMPISGEAGSFENLPGPLPQSSNTSPVDDRFQRVQLNHSEAVGTVSQATRNGRTVNILTIDRVIIPREPGRLEIGPARIDFYAVVGERPRGVMDAPWDDRSIVERQVVRAPAASIDVLPLPEDGKPANFSGLVGNYSVLSSVDTQDVAVGDPINLSISVAGPYPLTLVPPIDLAKQSAFDGFRVPRTPILPTTNETAARFDAVIRPRTQSATSVGPVELSYFDPKQKAYRVAQSRPITLNVRPSTTITLPDEHDEPVPEPAKQSAQSGPADIYRGPISPGAESFNLPSSLLTPRLIALVGIPPLACALAASLSIWRRRTAAGAGSRRRRQAFRAFRRRSRSAARETVSRHDSLAHALTDFVADWYDQAPRSLTAPQAAAQLGDQSDIASADLRRLLLDSDSWRFRESESAPQFDTLRTSAESAVASFVRAQRRRPG